VAATDDDSARRFADFSSTAHPRAPLYVALSAAIARDPELAGLLRDAPETQRMPVLLFACIHALVLDEPDHELAEWYPNLTPDHRSPTDRALVPTFERFVDEHRSRLSELLATRTTQTNEVGRCGLFLPAFGLIADEVGPIAHLDVGASGGLNLLLDRFQFRYTSDGRITHLVGGPSAVVVTVATTGDVPIPRTLPSIVARCGVDRQPIDVTDDVEARWLEACVWPDQPERFHRLVAAIDIARSAPPELLAGDAVASLAPAIERLGGRGHPVVTNSWVLNYLTAEDRIAYLDELDRIGAERDLSWVYAEAPALIPELPNGPDPRDPQRTVLSMVRWRNGDRVVDHLATCHPHGFWMQWR
jgi:hypothetical protein